MPIASIFSVAPPYVSSNVVSELQKRGLYHKEYAGNTLRENIGVPVPPVRDWSSQE